GEGGGGGGVVDVVVDIHSARTAVRVVLPQAIGQDRRQPRIEGVVTVPDEQVSDDEGMLRIRADPILVPTRPHLDLVRAGLRVALVVVETDEGKGPDIDLLVAAGGLLDRTTEPLHRLRTGALQA